MGKVIAAGCFCPLPGVKVQDFLPKGAVWIPTSGGHLGAHEEVAQRMELIPGHEDGDLILVTSHAPCPSNPDDVEAYSLTQSYVDTLLHAGKRAVGMFLGKSLEMINPGSIADPLVHEVFSQVSDESRFWRRRKDKLDFGKIRRIKIAPFFERNGATQEGAVHISTLFPMKGAVDLLREWGDGAFPPRQYSKHFEDHHIDALEAQFV